MRDVRLSNTNAFTLSIEIANQSRTYQSVEVVYAKSLLTIELLIHF